MNSSSVDGGTDIVPCHETMPTDTQHTHTHTDDDVLICRNWATQVIGCVSIAVILKFIRLPTERVWCRQPHIMK